MDTLNMVLFILTFFSAFVDPGHSGNPPAYFTVEPGDTTIELNEMNDAIFNCTCSICIIRPLFWTLENEAGSLATNNNNDQVMLDQRGISYNSTITTAVITIPSIIENNNTQIRCAGIQNPAEIIESSYPVTLTIIDTGMGITTTTFEPTDVTETPSRTSHGIPLAFSMYESIYFVAFLVLALVGM